MIKNLKYHFMKYDMIHEKLPEEWLHGIPLANGDMGVMLWGENSNSNNKLIFTLDKAEAWETREQQPDYSIYNYQNLKDLILKGEFSKAKSIFGSGVSKPMDKTFRPTRLPMPRFELDFGAEIFNFNSRLSIYDAICGAIFSVKDANIPIKLKTLVHAQENLILIQLDTPPSVKIPFKIKSQLTTEHFSESEKNNKNNINNNYSASKILNKWGYKPSEQFSDDSNDSDKPSINFLYQEIPKQGGYMLGVFSEEVEDHKLNYWISIEIEYINDKSENIDTIKQNLIKKIRRNIENARSMSETTFFKTHHMFWHNFWKKSYISIPDSQLENLFYLELYKLACCSRPGKLPCTLQGLWTKDGVMPPWSGDYHLDMNVQETYWPTYPTNHLELAEPLNELLTQNIPRFEDNCKKFFGFDGIHTGCAIGPKGERVFGYYTAEYWPGSAAWAAHNLWLYWKYSYDMDFLKNKALPFIEGSLKTYESILEKDEDGYLCLPISYSPEYHENAPKSWGKNSTNEIALIKFMIKALVEAYKLLNINSERIEELQDLDEELDYPADMNGFQIYENEQLNFSHRHFSHLMAIHPLTLVTTDGGKDDKFLIDSSLHRIHVMGTGLWTGWSWPWMSLIASRAGYGDMALKMLKDFLCFITPNAFHINGDPRKRGISQFYYNPMTLEAGFCSIAATCEMMLQSWNEIIRVFATIPTTWSNAYFNNLRAEGAFLVDSYLKDGKVQFVKIKSIVGNKCKLLNPFNPLNPDAYVFTIDGKLLKHSVEKIIKFETSSDLEYVILPNNEFTDDFEKMDDFQVKKDDNIENWFGLKKFPLF